MSFLDKAWNFVKDTALPWVGQNIFNLGDAAATGFSIAEQSKIAERNYSLAEKYNQLNYENMLENQQYQRDLQKDIFAREDNAVQRRVADLEAAGLSKTLAAGSAAGAGSIVSSTAAERGFTGKDASVYKQLADMQVLNTLRQQSLNNEALAHNLDIAEKAGVMTTDNSSIAQVAKAISGIFDIDLAEFGADAAKIIGEALSNMFPGNGDDDDLNIIEQIAGVATGNVSKNDVSPIVQVALDAASTVDPKDNDKLTYTNQVKTHLPNGTKRQSKSFGGYGGYSGGKNYRAVFVK